MNFTNPPYMYKFFYNVQILDEIKKRAATRFQDSRSKDVYLIDYPEDYGKRVLSMDGYQNIPDKKDGLLGEWEKRAPMGFYGTRGKKIILDALEELEKRGIMDFHVSKLFHKRIKYHSFRFLSKRMTNVFIQILFHSILILFYFISFISYLLLNII